MDDLRSLLPQPPWEGPPLPVVLVGGSRVSARKRMLYQICQSYQFAGVTEPQKVYNGALSIVVDDVRRGELNVPSKDDLEAFELMTWVYHEYIQLAEGGLSDIGVRNLFSRLNPMAQVIISSRDPVEELGGLPVKSQAVFTDLWNKALETSSRRDQAIAVDSFFSTLHFYSIAQELLGRELTGNWDLVLDEQFIGVLNALGR